MSRKLRILRNVVIGLAALAIIVVVIAIAVVQTDWFRNYVKQKIIASTEESTGGRVEVGSFQFDWRHLRAVVNGFVLHGDEPPGVAPLLSVPRLQVDLRLFTSFHHLLDVAYLGVERPQANILVLPDGRTNLPTPKTPPSKQAPLQPVIDLGVGHFELNNGLLVFESQKQNWNARGDNLRAQFWFNALKRGYSGQLSFEPFYVASGRNTPVKFTITLPVTLFGDRVEFHHASVTTAQTNVAIDGSVDNLRDPKITAHVNGHVALADLKNVTNLPVPLEQRNLPKAIDLDANATLAKDNIQVTALRLGLGHSDLEASGILKSSTENAALGFKSRLSLDELGRLARVQARPEGMVLLNGRAKLDSANNYQVTGNVQANNVSFEENGRRFSHINLNSALNFDPHNLDLLGLRLSTGNGDFSGDLRLHDFARYQLEGRLRSLDLHSAAQAMGLDKFGYDGIVSGPISAEGDLKSTPVTKSLTARAQLSIAPGRQGIPISGRLNGGYNGAADNLHVDNSFLALPHSRLNLNGDLGKQLSVTLTTSDVNDLLAGTSLSGKSPVDLRDRSATFTGVITGHLTSPQISGQLAARGFSVEGREFDALTATVAAARNGAAIRNGSLTRGNMQTQFSAQVGLKNWQPLSNEPVSATASIRNGDVADVIALAGQSSSDFSGALSADMQVGGTIGNPTGSVNVQAANGTLLGEPFDRFAARVNLTNQLITVSTASLQAGAAHVNLTGEFQHPKDSVTTGTLHAHIDSNSVDLAQLRTLAKQRPGTSGAVQVNLDASGSLSEKTQNGKVAHEFQLTALNGDASARGLRFDGQNYGDANLTARTSGRTVAYRLTSDFAGSSINANGNTQLVDDYPTTADASIRNLPIERVLTVARRTDIPAKGILSGTAHFSGTKDHPEGNVDVDLANAVIYDEPIDHVRAKATYLARSIDIPQLEVTAGPSQLSASGRFDHADGDLETGNLQLRVNSSRIDLARVHNVQSRRPGLSGVFQLSATGAAEVRKAEPRIMVRNLDAKVAANRIALQGKNYGDATLTANTSGGKVDFVLTSNLANASIQGRGSAQLTDHYPVDAEINFKDLTWARLSGLLVTENEEGFRFDAAADGQIKVHGPAMKPDELEGSAQLTRLEAKSIPASKNAKPVMLQNQGPIVASLDHQVLHITSAHLTGPQTDIQAKGSVPLQGQAMDLTVNANANLGLLQDFDRDITSSGSIVVATAVRGTISDPIMNGKVELHNGTFFYTGLPNGISNANGTVVLTGNSASVRNLTAESGGGKVTIGGFAIFTGNRRFGLRADASGVRVRVQEGFSVFADGDIRLAGTADGSQLSGTATINRISYSPQTDLGSVLSRAAPSVPSYSVPSYFMSHMKLDVRVVTSTAMAVQTSLAESLQAQADLRIRGTAAQPAVLGRINITEGTLGYFGNKYTVNSGTIAFYNPVRIAPVVDISLETVTKGVDVTLRLSGPVDNLKLSYTSDPPLQFQEIVGLLAAGQTPTSDPTLLAEQPAAPTQNFQQMGESALVSRTLADPVANRFQRVFGVSQLRIDPAFVSGSTLPQAQVTLQQQITSSMTFTYVSSLDNVNAQTIRVELTLNPQWSAVAMRDQNGIFSVNFLYKKHIR